MDNTLPSGTYFLPDDWVDKAFVGDFSRVTCECGCSVVFGKDCNPEFHSSFCPLYTPKVDDYDK